jgi:coatomer subunit delta
MLTHHSVHIIIKEHVSASLSHEGGLNSMELVGDMNLHISDASVARIKLQLSSSSSDFGSDLQLKQHPNVAKFAGNQDRVVALKDPSRSFPVNQPLAVLKWRYAGKDESLVPLSSVYKFQLALWEISDS